MGWAKEQYIADLEFEEEREAAYQEDQSRLCLSMTCTQLVRPLAYDSDSFAAGNLYLRILGLAWFKQ